MFPRISNHLPNDFCCLHPLWLQTLPGIHCDPSRVLWGQPGHLHTVAGLNQSLLLIRITHWRDDPLNHSVLTYRKKGEAFIAFSTVKSSQIYNLLPHSSLKNCSECEITRCVQPVLSLVTNSVLDCVFNHLRRFSLLSLYLWLVLLEHKSLQKSSEADCSKRLLY